MVGSSVDYRRLSELHEHATWFSADPCEDFFNFTCFNWFRNGSFHMSSFFGHLQDVFNEAIKGLLEEDRGPQDSPLARAQSFYKKCLSSNDEWKSRGGPIQFILEKIREFGSFPLIDKSWSYGYHFDITDLLVYFNQNRTIMRELVPYISLDWMDNSVARLTFIPDQSVLKKLLGIGQNDAIDPGKFLKAFGQLALLICEEVGHNCSAGEVSEELKEMYLFVQKISANTTKDSLADEKNYNSIFLHRLSEVDALVSSVNWTKYLLKTVPAIHHSYIINDPIVIAAKTQQETINSILLSTRKEVIVNYAMLLYTLSWIEYMDEKYRGVVKGKDDVCLRITLLRFRETIIANYERRTNGNMAMQKAKEMEETIKEEFHATILSNSWLSEHMKKALILKANMMRLRSGYENIHVKEEEMETFYKNLDWKEDSEKMTFLMMEDIFVTIAKNAEFEYLNDTTNRGDDYYESLIGRMHGAFYAREYNMIGLTPSFLQFPRYGEKYPRSYIYGSLGSAIAHELMHGFDNHGVLFDENGNHRRSWLPDEFYNQFHERTSCLIKMYNDSEIITIDSKVDGIRTLHENIADNEGVKLAFKAYRKLEKKFGAEGRFEKMQDFTNEQMFFLGYSMGFCNKLIFLPFFLDGIVKADTHAPPMLRINNVFANMPEFAEAFHCAPGTPMNPSTRCPLY